MKTYCADCGREMDIHKTYTLTYVSGEVYCPKCLDIMLLHWVQTLGFGLSLQKDFNTEKDEQRGRHYG